MSTLGKIFLLVWKKWDFPLRYLGVDPVNKQKKVRIICVCVAADNSQVWKHQRNNFFVPGRTGHSK